MKLQRMDIPENTDEDVVQFIKHLEENLDPNDEYDCTVELEVVEYDPDQTYPGDEIPMRGTDPDLAGEGVYFHIEAKTTANTPASQLSQLFHSFFQSPDDPDRVNARLSAHREAGSTYYGYIFPFAN